MYYSGYSKTLPKIFRHISHQCAFLASHVRIPTCTSVCTTQSADFGFQQLEKTA